MIPCKWGQGQLFAFSALDGDSYFNDDLTGVLSGDKPGVVFHTRCRRTLFFGNLNKFIELEVKCVTSDMLTTETLLGTLSMVFTQRHLVVGEYVDMLGIFLSVDGYCDIIKKGDIEIHDTNDGEYTALLRRNGRFAFAFGKSEVEVVKLCEDSVNIDLDALKKSKLKPFENCPSEENKYASL